MGDRHDYVALEWVKGEIAETLKQAHHAIETLLDDPQATHALSDCLACIHQVHGSLQMVEFYGAALLAERLMLATAESCTGGWVAEVVTATAGSSGWFDCGFITYSNDAKWALLGVSPMTLARYGADRKSVV